MIEIGTQFKLNYTHLKKPHVYELVGQTENKHFWKIKNTSYPMYDERGKARLYAKWMVNEKITFNKWIIIN